MEILLNGEKFQTNEGATVSDILREKGTNPKTVIVETDGVILKPEEFETTVLRDGSTVEVLRFVGGG